MNYIVRNLISNFFLLTGLIIGEREYNIFYLLDLITSINIVLLYSYY